MLNIYVRGVKWINNILQNNSRLWLMKIGDFFDQSVSCNGIPFGYWRLQNSQKLGTKTAIWYIWIFKKKKKSSLVLLFLWKNATIKIK